jgi:REP element-mobilizing transposase RayT
MPTKKILTPLLSDRFYHIYNRGNDGEKLFYTEENYRYFMHKYHCLLAPFLDTYAYCLIPNHFHFLIKTRESEDDLFHLKISHQFRRLFQSYALSINKQEGRSGSLFRKYFRRIHVDNMLYLRRLVFYIHFNPQKHQVVQNFRYYPYSSYISFEKGNLDSFLDIGSVIAWFNDTEDFFNYHDVMHDEKKIKMICLEDD